MHCVKTVWTKFKYKDISRGLYFWTVNCESIELVSYHTVGGSNFINPLYTGRLLHCHLLDEYICHLRNVAFILFFIQNPVSKH